MSTDGYDPRLGTPVGTAPAGLGKRAGARFIDWIVAGVVGAILFWLLNKSTGIPEWVSILPGAGFGFLYFVGFEVTTGATPGKKLLGLHVEGAGGRPSPVSKNPRSATPTCCSISSRVSAACCGSSPPWA